MRIAISHPPSSIPDAQEALRMLLSHTKTLTTSFVTVAAPYKPTRYTRAFCEIPDTAAAHGRYLLSIVFDIDEDLLSPSTATIPHRAEWTHTALLLPSPDAPALDGDTIAGFASAYLIVWYALGRCAGLLYSSERDTEARAALAATAWHLINRPSRWRRFRTRLSLPRWNGIPSLTPIPSEPATPVPDQAAEPDSAATGPTTRLDPNTANDAELARWLRTDVLAAESPSMLKPSIDDAEEPARAIGEAMENAGDTEPAAPAIEELIPINTATVEETPAPETPKPEGTEQLAKEQPYEHVITLHRNGKTTE